MPEPLKNLYTQSFIQSLADCIKKRHSQFDRDLFINSIFKSSFTGLDWADLELKQRMRHITTNLYNHLNLDYLDALPVLVDCSKNFTGFESMFFPEYVELHGQNEFEASMQALEVMTQFSSAEFSVRPFITTQPVRMMRQMFEWSNSSNSHVRRLASEGCRPRLPWAMALSDFKKNPEAILPILENLKNDDSEYVRKSVANNLNDISKDHPDTVIQLAKSWINKSPETDLIIKHACRGLLKQGNTQVLLLFGLHPPEHIKLSDFTCDKKIKMGTALNFSARLHSAQTLGLLRIEYRIYFQKANASLSPKVFKISEYTIVANEKHIKRTHSIRPITTRKYYPGLHQLEILVNGVAMDKKDFYII